LGRWGSGLGDSGCRPHVGIYKRGGRGVRLGCAEAVRARVQRDKALGLAGQSGQHRGHKETTLRSNQAAPRSQRGRGEANCEGTDQEEADRLPGRTLIPRPPGARCLVSNQSTVERGQGKDDKAWTWCVFDFKLRGEASGEAVHVKE
jgi:hypothetical protein